MLVVEDDPDDRDLMSWGLKQHGFDVEIEFAVDGVEAQRKLAALEGKDLPLAIVTDLKLPRINGIELLRWARSRPELKDVPKAVITSSTELRDEQSSLDLGAVRYLEKPMTLEGYGAVVAALRGMLGGA